MMISRRSIFKITLKRGEREFSFRFGQSIAKSGFCFPKFNDVLNADFQKKSFSENYVNSTGEPKDIFVIEKRFKFLANNYFCSIHNLEYYKLEFPTAYDVLAGLTKYDVGNFENFCSEFGYSSDSIKAEKTYKLVLKEFEMVRQLWSDEEIELLREVN